MALVLHRHALTKPSDLAQAKNGYLLGEMLEPTAGGDVLHHLAARAFNAMHAKAARMDIDLKLTDGYRPYATQESIFLARYKTLWRPFTDTKHWQGKTWWRWSGATAAVPGTSNHGWGLAVDLNTVGLGSLSTPGTKLRWLDEYANDYGFTWELLPSEPWHLRYYVGDQLPVAVLQHELAVGRFPDPIPPIEDDDMYFVKVPTLAGFDIYQVYRHEATGFLVRRLVPGVEWAVLEPRYGPLLTTVDWAHVSQLVEAPGI